MSEMVERVAAAIQQCCVDLKDHEAGACQPEIVARAAIAAMREPTTAMSDAADRAKNMGVERRAWFETEWRAAIDAALIYK